MTATTAVPRMPRWGNDTNPSLPALDPDAVPDLIRSIQAVTLPIIPGQAPGMEKSIQLEPLSQLTRDILKCRLEAVAQRNNLIRGLLKPYKLGARGPGVLKAHDLYTRFGSSRMLIQSATGPKNTPPVEEWDDIPKDDVPAMLTAAVDLHQRATNLDASKALAEEARNSLIRELHRTGRFQNLDLATMSGDTPSTIHNIVTFKSGQSRRKI